MSTNPKNVRARSVVRSRTNRAVRSVVFGLVAAGGLAIAAPRTLFADNPSTAASADLARQTAEAQRLLAQFKKPNLQDDQRRQLVAQLMALGDEGPRRLAMQCGTDVEAKASAYVARFEKAAGAAIQARVKAAGGAAKADAEVADLRKTILDVSRAGNLTKEMIVSQADPAVEKLSALLSLTPAQVVDSDSSLKIARDEVLDAASTYQDALAKVPELRRKGIPSIPSVEAIELDLANREALAALLATPMSKSDRSVLTSNVLLAAQLDSEEAAGILAVNRIRILVGLNADTIDPKLVDAARGHSKDMVEHKFFDHASAVSGKETPWKRAALAGTSASSENIYAGSKSGLSAFKAWWHSPGHHKNIMGNSHRIGLGRFQSHWTEMFGG